MFTLTAKIREKIGKKVKVLRKEGVLPAVLYGPKVANLNLEVDLKEFEKTYKEAGESSLIKLKIKNEKLKIDEFLVLIHDIQFDHLTEKPIHIDFYQPSLKKEIEAAVPLIFEGEAPAVKELGGTLIKEISEIKVKALPHDLPKEIKVSIGKLKTFRDRILIKDLKIPRGIKVLRGQEEIVASVSPLAKIEEELAKPIEEKVEEVKEVKKEKKEKEEEETEKK
ncbi:MAG: 50S ribosomal protein L25 [Candidatus Nealsonbacteria bacterium CG08_land_8_20_14_0_20_38_20]|uniref:Large ribosomal subunit protein bL25 n=1 Tax=Candidatus Nealsonbacteria bacterium CG08_land_8_20_14_0_20_38_20 TaxID=1974705 RepID=A0A2H0YN67_9BACT|nr:MAG: 50S ribosomal protein L25 [Candidatus Nealsonbacteria bacterium CG08_land_8_20_14_0_20_38_20]